MKYDYNEIIKQIVTQVKSENNLKSLDINSVTYLGTLNYFKTVNTTYSLVKKISVVLSSIGNIGGSHIKNDDRSDIVLYSLFRTNFLSPNITHFVCVLYHELYHEIDWQKTRFNLVNYEDFIDFLDSQLRFKFRNKYYEDTDFHDSMFSEISADMYALRKTREFFEKNKQYTIDEKYLSDAEKKVSYFWNSYNLSEKLDLLLESNRFDVKDNGIPLGWVFFNNDLTLKSLDEIFKNPVFENIDKRIVVGYFNTKAFRKSLDLSNVSEESKQLFYNILIPERDNLRKLIVTKHKKYYEIDESKKSEYTMIDIIYIVCSIVSTLILTASIREKELVSLYTSLISKFITDKYLLKRLVRKVITKYKIKIDERLFDSYFESIQDSLEEKVGKSI